MATILAVLPDCVEERMAFTPRSSADSQVAWLMASAMEREAAASVFMNNSFQFKADSVRSITLAITETVWTGYCPMAVSPESITASTACSTA